MGRARLVLAVGLLSALAALAFPFAPVRQPEVTYTWTPADGTAAPCRSCRTSRSSSPRRSAARPPGPAASCSRRCRRGPTRRHCRSTACGWSARPRGCRSRARGVDLGTVPLPPGACTLALGSDAAATVVTLDGTPVLSHTGDVRPDVAGDLHRPARRLGTGVTPHSR